MDVPISTAGLDLSLNKEEGPIKYFSWPQHDALQSFLPTLHPYLPYSNPLYNRMKAPHNLPSRHCLFAATFSPGTTTIPKIFTILFADRSRHEESQIWTFNSLNSTTKPLTASQQESLTMHMNAAVRFLKESSIPEAPGWPFSPILKFACLHEHLTSTLVAIGNPSNAVPRQSHWNCWLVNTSTISPASEKALSEGYTITRVPDDQLDIVISTSSIPRQPSTYKLLPSVGVLDPNDKLIAWGYVGIDGSFATLYVLPDFRGRGISSIIGRELLSRLNNGDFSDMGYDGKSGWVHSDVYDGNAGSEAVMRGLGGFIAWKSSYVWIDSARL
ncbi:uncharacterized protein LY89DRAFT_473415 [Mollisia scopiformis]|uniref:N-acetyltransferase domain-containing protein n=1 Tax=Mollisia scopiformis TaxID=149040 RepID=A0A194XIW8_MOLSC|nr:uncharacterized protein LY89DRAFT_473415 [Mollisia scopiformis]KUJ20185.1 hypothetical protein LY89DRAFT_473415 [Mollisia scopiformis]